MNSRVLTTIVILTPGTLILPTPAAAQQPLALAAAQAEAHAKAPEVADLEARVRGAATVLAQAGRRLRQDPAVSASYFNGSLIGRADEHAWNLVGTLPLDVSGSWKPRAASAASDLARVELERDDGLRALDERVALAMADVALQQR